MELLADVAARIRAAGGWAPDQPYPPTWLFDGDGKSNDGGAKSNNAS